MANPRVPYRLSSDRPTLKPMQIGGKPKPLMVHLVVNVEHCRVLIVLRLEDAQLDAGVLLHRPMPIEMIGRDVGERSCVAVEADDVLELETR